MSMWHEGSYDQYVEITAYIDYNPELFTPESVVDFLKEKYNSQTNVDIKLIDTYEPVDEGYNPGVEVYIYYEIPNIDFFYSCATMWEPEEYSDTSCDRIDIIDDLQEAIKTENNDLDLVDYELNLTDSEVKTMRGNDSYVRNWRIQNEC